MLLLLVLLCDTAGEAQCVNAQTPPLVVVHAVADERVRLVCGSVPLAIGQIRAVHDKAAVGALRAIIRNRTGRTASAVVAAAVGGGAAAGAVQRVVILWEVRTIRNRQVRAI